MGMSEKLAQNSLPTSAGYRAGFSLLNPVALRGMAEAYQWYAEQNQDQRFYVNCTAEEALGNLTGLSVDVLSGVRQHVDSGLLLSAHMLVEGMCLAHAYDHRNQPFKEGRIKLWNLCLSGEDVLMPANDAKAKSPEVIVETTGSATAPRHNKGKIPLHLLYPGALRHWAAASVFGVQKYSPHSWMKGFQHSALIGSLIRHITAIGGGEELDQDSGLPHVGFVMANAAILHWHQVKKAGIDDLTIASDPEQGLDSA